MITLLFLTYAAICIAVFKLFRVRISSWSVSTAVVGGVFGVGGLMIALNCNQPFTTDARILFYTTPIVSTVIGRVIDVPVSPNVPVHKDDVLLRLDPAPFRDAVDQKRAQLAQSKQNVEMMKAAPAEASGQERKPRPHATAPDRRMTGTRSPTTRRANANRRRRFPTSRKPTKRRAIRRARRSCPRQEPPPSGRGSPSNLPSTASTRTSRASRPNCVTPNSN